MSLGSSLQGGDEKAEEVRLALLGFKRYVEALKDKVDERKNEVDALVTERKEIRRQMQIGRALLDVDQRLRELERSLIVTSNGPQQESQSERLDHDLSDSGDESEEGQERSTSISRLSRYIRQYLLSERTMNRIGSDHPFVANQEGRMSELRSTILLDLGNALKQAGGHDDEQTMKIVALYRDLGKPKEVVKLLRERKP